MKTDNELKELTAKLMPDSVLFFSKHFNVLTWMSGPRLGHEALPTEMLYVCQMIASGMNASDRGDYLDTLHRKWANSQSKLSFIGWLETECTWQMKIECAAQVKEIK